MKYRQRIEELEKRANASGEWLIRNCLPEGTEYIVNGKTVKPKDYQTHPEDKTIDIAYVEDW